MFSDTFLGFLKEIVCRSRRRKTFLIIDNGPCHNLNSDGKRWLMAHHHRIEFRLPPYAPELNPIEGVWKVTEKRTTHNRFYPTTDERDAALRSTFGLFLPRPSLIAGHVARFLWSTIHATLFSDVPRDRCSRSGSLYWWPLRIHP